MRTLLAAVLTVLTFAIPVSANDDLAAHARAVLKTYCSQCHGGPGSEGGDYNFLNHADLVAKRGDDPPLVVAGKPEASYLWERAGVKKSMPPRTIPRRPSDGELATLEKWIKAGAPPFPEEAKGRKFIPLVEVLTAVRDHLRKSEREARPYLRYFTLTHLHNDPKVPDADLRLYRAALSKALNSLSLKPGIVLPEAIDPAAAVLAVDVRRLDWDRHNLWQAIVREYPYGLKYGGHPNTDLKSLDEDIGEITHCDLPLVRADWFVATATRPPLYHTLLQLPHHAGELERRLGVDIPANFREDKLARAGFAKSGVSGQNRLLERHDAPLGGFYWKSYDFKPDSARAKLTRFPLGPLGLFPTGRHPYAGQAFAHDGGEIIFGLPNGLQGYLLINGKDERIDEGPIQVVSDPLKTSGTPAIVTGVSCMACHKHGMIPFTDTVRAGSAVFGEAEDKVRRLYPDAKTMADLVEADQRRFLDALDRAVGPFLKVGPDRAKPIKEFAEPVGEIARSYRLGYLDLATVALELDVSTGDELVRRVGEKRFKQLGLDALLKPGGRISRLEWEAVDAYSLMQEVARELRATPFVR